MRVFRGRVEARRWVMDGVGAEVHHTEGAAGLFAGLQTCDVSPPGTTCGTDVLKAKG